MRRAWRWLVTRSDSEPYSPGEWMLIGSIAMTEILRVMTWLHL